jgi:hypothetical protein
VALMFKAKRASRRPEVDDYSFALRQASGQQAAPWLQIDN